MSPPPSVLVSSSRPAAVGLARVLTPSRALPLALLLSALCFAPTLSAGFYGDDFVFLNTLAGAPPCMCEPNNLYRYSSGEPERVATFVQEGLYPWWTHPDFKISLWRPLTSATIQLDHALFGSSPLGYHVHSVLWFLLLIVAVAPLYRRLTPGPLALLAMFVFALDESHWMTVSWMCNRHAIVSAVAGVWAMRAHLRWREDGWRPGLPLSLLAFALGLLGGESGIQTLGFLVGYELVGAPSGWGSRVRALLPALLLGVGYYGLYKAAGYGSFASGPYTDPLMETGRFLTRAAEIAPAMLAELVGGTEAFYGLYRPGFPVWLLVTIGVLGTFAWLLWRALAALPPAERRSVGWLLLGGLLALAPPIASQRDPYGTSRSLLFASIASALAVSVVLGYGWSVLKRRLTLPSGARWAVLAPCAVLALMNLLVEPIAVPVAVNILAGASQMMMDTASTAARHEHGDAEIVLLNQAQYLTGYGPLMTAYAEHRPPKPWWNVSWSPLEQEIARTGPRTFELSLKGGALLDHDFEWFYRSPNHRVRAGEHFSNRRMQVKVMEANERGPTRLEFTFDRPLEDSSLHFMAWSEGTLRQVVLPAIGGTLRIAAQE